jgi:predicted dehydrogenase
MKIGVMGCANIAQKSVIPAMLACPEWEVAAIASRDIHKAKSYTNKFDGDALGSYEELLERSDIEAIYMPLPTGLHEEWVIKSLIAGKHILVEKSLAMNHASALKMAEVAKDQNLVMMENFMFWHHSQQKTILDILDSGELGDFRLLRASFGFPPLGAGNFRYNKDLGGGAILDSAAYCVKISQMIFGWDVSVQAATLFVDEQGVDLYGSATIVAQDGRTAQLSWGFDNFYQCNCEIWGSKGKLYADRVFTAQPGYSPKLVIEKQDIKTEYQLKGDNHFINILKAFHHTIVNKLGAKTLDEIVNQARLLSEVRDIATVVKI